MYFVKRTPFERFSLASRASYCTMSLMRALVVSLCFALAGASSAQTLFSSAALGGSTNTLYDSRTDKSIASVAGTVGPLSGSAKAQSDYGILHAYAHAASPAPMFLAHAESHASFTDMLTISGGTGTGTFIADWTTDGSETAEGSAIPHADLYWTHNPNGVIERLQPGTHTQLGQDYYATTFTYGVPFAFSATLEAFVEFYLGGAGSGTTDFSSTAVLSQVRIYDPSGQPVQGVTVTGASGHVYPSPVPEPATFATLGVGLAAIMRRSRTRKR